MNRREQQAMERWQERVSQLSPLELPPGVICNEGADTICYKFGNVDLSSSEEYDLKSQIIKTAPPNKSISIFNSDGTLWYALTKEQLIQANLCLGT